MSPISRRSRKIFWTSVNSERFAVKDIFCSPKTIKCTQKPKIELMFTGNDQSSERANERMPFPTSYLQLALAHARNSRVKKEKNQTILFFFSHCFFKAAARGRTCIQLLIGCYSLYINMVRIQWQKNMNSFISFKTE